MIRFGVIVTVVVAAIGLLIVGAVAGELALVYGSIGLAGLALLLLIVGVAVWRDEVFASSGQRGERGLAAAGTVGQAARPAAGPGTAEDWRERPSSAPGPGPMPGPGPAAGPRQGGDTREFLTPIGRLPERDAPADRNRPTGEPRPTEQLLRPADPAGRPGREPGHRERSGREAAPAVSSGRDRDAAAAEWPGRDAPPGERSGREATPDRSAREPATARRPDRVERYPTVVGPERFDPADNPTRLAHRLDSLADFGRQPGTDATGSPSSPAGRPGGQRLPARAVTDPLAGAVGEQRSGADPLTASPLIGSVAPRPTGQERGSGAGGDAAEPARAAVPSAPVSTAPAPAAAVPTVAGPSSAVHSGPGPASTGPAGPGLASTGMIADLGSRGPEVPAEPGRGRPEAARARTDSATAAGDGASPAWPRVPSGADPGFSAEPTPAVPASPAAAGTAPTAGGTDAAPALGPDDEVLVVPGIARYHKADCILIRFLSEDDLEVTSRRDAEATGCAPCRACRPDRPSAAG